MAQQGFNVNPSALRSQAAVWDAQAKTMGQVVAEVAGTQPPSGVAEWALGDHVLFPASWLGYAKVHAMMTRVCEQGSSQMGAVAEALRLAARRYEATEETNARNARHAGY